MLSLGSTGDAVGHLQQALIECGYPVPASESAGSVFGPGTLAAVKSFQSSQGLSSDGAVGPVTQAHLDNPKGAYVASGWRYDSNSVPAASRPATDAAVSQIGLHEDPPHSNQVAGNRYKNGSSPWCAFFVSWSFGHVDGGSPFGVLDSAWALWHWATQQSRMSPSPAPGDAFVILRGDPKQGFCHGHTGLVTGISDDGRLLCVEGNAGDAVRATIRKHEDVYCLIRPVRS